MTVSRLLTIALPMAAAFAAGALAERSGVLKPSHTDYLQLTGPVPLHSDVGAGSLPTGTALYQDHAFDEGHVRYTVYVNVKGPLPARPIRSDKRNLIDPLWGDQHDDAP